PRSVEIVARPEHHRPKPAQPNRTQWLHLSRKLHERRQPPVTRREIAQAVLTSQPAQPPATKGAAFTAPSKEQREATTALEKTKGATNPVAPFPSALPCI